MGSTREIELDAELVAKIEARAVSLGRSREDLITEALQHWLEGGRLRAILDASRHSVAGSDDEAMALALAELKAARSERTAGPGI